LAYSFLLATAHVCRRSRLSAAVLLIALGIPACSRKPPSDSALKADAAARSTIVFLSDFGTANDSVAICKAVILEIAPAARIMDITHQVTPYSVEEGGRFLASVSPYYPPGTIFLAVVDPGVGTSRKAIIVKSRRGQFFVLPDNGLISLVAERDGIESAREITNPSFMLSGALSSTFHGRDVFSPTAAHLAAGEDWMLAGPEIHDLVRLHPPAAILDSMGINGHVVALDDPYGSLITDITAGDFTPLGYTIGDKVKLRIEKKGFTIPYTRTFMDVPVGQPLLYVDSRGRIAIAINERDFSQANGIHPPASIFIPRKFASKHK
jgi:S-adenosylmethionine hydrolase